MNPDKQRNILIIIKFNAFNNWSNPKKLTEKYVL